MTSVLVLFFLFLVNYLLNLNLQNIKQMESAAFLAIFGLINIPIIKYSVVWWNTLHQPASITSFKTTIHLSILLPIFTTTIFIGFWIIVVFIYRLRFDILTNKISLIEKKL
jgi:heme exporter protein C